MQMFEEFYEIKLGEPAEGLPSFSFVRVDSFARMYEREYGTIVPREADSVTSYDIDVLIELLTDYLIEITGEYKIVGVRIIMKPDEMFREKALLDFFKGRLAMLCIRSGLGVNVEGVPVSVHDTLFGDKLSEWDCEIINHLVGGLRKVPEDALEHFKNRFPSLMVGYTGPSVELEPEPEPSFMEQAVEMIDDILRRYGEVPQGVSASATKITYTLFGGTEIRVLSNAISDRVTVSTGYGRASTYRVTIGRAEHIVAEAVSRRSKNEGSTVGPRTYKNILAELYSTSGLFAEPSDDGDCHIIRSLRSDRPQIRVKLHRDKIVAMFTHKDTEYTANLMYSGNVDDFVDYLRAVLSNRYKVAVWSV